MGILTGSYQFIFMGHDAILSQLVNALFDAAKSGVEITIGLLGILCLWLGLLNIAKEAGMVDWLARRLTPLFRTLMPEIPEGHPAIGAMALNFAANILGLDNAATPMGLKAMKELQTLNPNKERATNAQIMFLVINASSITLLPVSIFMFRAQQGASDPTSVFIPILLATTASTLTGILSTALMQRISLFNKSFLLFVGTLVGIIGGLIVYLHHLPSAEMVQQSSVIGHLILVVVITTFLVTGWAKKVPVYETFVEGAKEGFQIAITILPFLIAMLAAIAVFRASGALDFLLDGIRYLVELAGLDSDFIPALPTALIKPFSGSGARAMMIETMQHYGANSFPAFVSSVIQGSTETTLYVVALYYGSVGIKQVRHTIGCGLLADLAGVLAGIWVSYWFFA
ncbi:MAG: spore maturation protein [Alphaproteobacteria bacterium]|nr:spore maturation protein [Alphaproteobacteria bacterium]